MMVEADFSSSFLNAESAQDNDIISIVGKPVNEEKMNLKGQKYLSTNIPIQINGKDKIYSPSRETGNRFIKSWGKEMDNWLGKQATIKYVLKQIKGKTETYIEAYPLEATKI